MRAGWYQCDAIGNGYPTRVVGWRIRAPMPAQRRSGPTPRALAAPPPVVVSRWSQSSMTVGVGGPSMDHRWTIDDSRRVDGGTPSDVADGNSRRQQHHREPIHNTCCDRAKHKRGNTCSGQTQHNTNMPTHCAPRKPLRARRTLHPVDEVGVDHRDVHEEEEQHHLRVYTHPSTECVIYRSA